MQEPSSHEPASRLSASHRSYRGIGRYVENQWEPPCSRLSSTFEFTNLINEQYNYAEKCHVVELLWRVCLADAEMDRYEEQLVRKVVSLLHLEHKDFIIAKLRVQRQYSRSSYRDFDRYE